MENSGNNSVPSAGNSAVSYAFPTTFAQQRLWFLEKLQPGTTSYLIPWSVRIQGRLNIPALERSLNEIVERHETLRTTFTWKDGMPLQVVSSSLSIPLPVTDLSACSDPEQEAADCARKESHKPLDLERGPLVRAQLLRLAPEDHVLLLTMHHIIFDGWSRRVLVRELSALYEAFCNHRPSPLAALKLQYADYAVWQRKTFQGPKLARQLAYWRQKLAGAPPTLDLPTDRPHPPLQTFNGANVQLSFPEGFSDRLGAISREQGVTPFMTLLAGFQILLSRYSRQDDVVVGVPTANRNRSEIEDLIGFFANTLVVRTRVQHDATFREVLAEVKETTLGAQEHQDLPFEKLVEELQPERNLRQNPLFQVLFSFQNAAGRDFTLPGLKLRLLDLGEASAKFDLSVFLSENNGRLGGRIEYNTDIFDAATIERMAGHYQTLLASAINAPDTVVEQLPLMSPTERTRVLVDFNATEAAFPAGFCLHHLVEQAAAGTPDADAVICGTERIRYQELNERANQIAHYLIEQGAGPEVLVGVCLERGSDLLAAILGVLKSGSCYVPLDPSYPSGRLAAILEDAKAAMVLTQRSLAAQWQGSRRTVCLDADWARIGQQSIENPGVQVHPENLAYVLFTSGSTGRPKGVALEHHSAVTLVQWAMRVFTPQELAGVLLSTSVCFDLSIFEIFVPLSVGGKVIVVENALYLSSADAKDEVTLVNTVPSAMAELVRTRSVPVSVQTVNLAGEALPEALVDEIYATTNVKKVYNLYGPTEDTTYSTYALTRAKERVTIGRPLPNTQAYVLDAQGEPQPIGVPGELYLAGDGLARGYYGRADLTAERFVANSFLGKVGARMYRTGDLCRWRADGNLEYLGRLDHQVKLRGFRIELGEVEAALGKHPSVRQCVVMAREDEPGQKRLVAYIIAQGDKPLEEALRRHVQQSLPEFMIPSAFVVLDFFPLTPNGKVDRRALPKPEPSHAGSAAIVLPRNETEEKLLKIWKELLNVEPIGVKDNFFELGGHSLMAVRLLFEIKKQIGKEIPLSALFQGATIEYLANIVRGEESVSRAVVHEIQTGGPHPPFFAAVLAGVNALGYIPLSKHLGPEQPFYALQRPGPGPLADKRPYMRTEYEEVAGEYIAAMRTVQPEGPYYIGGTCEGAHIAFEMARQLEAQGQKVELLALFDTWVLENTQKRALWQLYYYSQRLRQLTRMPLRSGLMAMGKAFRNRIHWWTGSKSAPRKSDWIETYWPGKGFVAHKVQCRITIFKVPKQPFYYISDPLLGWGERTNSGVNLQMVRNGQHRLLLREPYVRELAAALSHSLAMNRNGRQVGEQLPTVSIVIPAYQCAQYIGQAIQSILDQSFRNYEIIVVNDGSPDTAQMEAALQPYRQSICYVKQPTRGPAAARNTGIRLARGKYVAFLDSDDYWAPEHLARQVGILEYQPGLSLAYCDCLLIKNEKPYRHAFELQPQVQDVSFEALLTEDCAISTSSTVVRRDAILAAGLFDEDYLRCEDFDMWLRLSFGGARMAYHRSAMVFHRVNEAGLSANRQAMLHDMVRVYRKVASTLRLSPQQLRIVQDMVARAEAENAIEQLKQSLENKAFADAREAASRANEVNNSWKLRLSLFALRVAPRFFRAMHLARAFVLRRRRYARRTNPEVTPSNGVPKQEHTHTPLVHQ